MPTLDQIRRSLRKWAEPKLPSKTYKFTLVHADLANHTTLELDRDVVDALVAKEWWKQDKINELASWLFQEGKGVIPLNHCGLAAQRFFVDNRDDFIDNEDGDD